MATQGAGRHEPQKNGKDRVDEPDESGMLRM